MSSDKANLLSNRILVFMLVTIGLISFYFCNKYLPSNLNNVENLAGNLMSPPNSIYEYRINNEAPFKYRILFKAVVQSSYHLMTESSSATYFFKTYKIWSAIFYSLTIVLFFIFLKTIGFTRNVAFYGTLLMLICPPFLVAYAPPIHTREDVMGYSILLTGLIFTVKKKPLFVLIFSLLGFLCRETILILPLFYFLYSTREEVWIRYGLPLLCGIAYLGYRIGLGVDSYDTTLGLRWNLNNPAQVVGFLFLTFGFLWPPYIHSMSRWRKIIKNKNNAIVSLIKTSPLILLLILITTFLGGIFNEMRLIYLAFPWVVAVSVNYLHQFYSEFKTYFTSLPYLVYATSILIITVLIGVFLFKYIHKILPPNGYGISYEFWVIFTLIHLFVVTILVPIQFSIDRKLMMKNVL